ncbi:unnamed protein product [Pneumocystis jirovecii]|uniref:BAH domain-containing protein n=2 Tax=Pneumocystis jirovecii TaxID=42068 RepID=L0PA34_PNEJI|nr:uncharacterized protein T551_03225 [Pneumocystis jirovecii RU7]KTW27231.1 hypothetical protein T551_03225 [Pneumocystis jirovecii RU7]CCJ28475.1 unnamed protein product [Pneumocystis jirovecii]
MSHIPLTKAHKDAIKKILNILYNAVDESGRSISKIFEELPDKKEIPDYYEVIKRPMALNIIKENINKNLYNTFHDFITDVAQIYYNAKLYNRRSSVIYSDACLNEMIIVKELSALKDKKLVDDSILPVLGPLPPSSPGEEKSDDDGFDPDIEDKNEEDEEDEDEDDEDDVRHKRRRRETRIKSYEPPKVMRFDTGDIKRKRGRPPKVDTPDEARMKIVLRVIRKEKDERGRTLFTWFEKFPDDKLNQSHKIKQSISLEDIRQKLKRREYKTLKSFLDDLDLLYNNIKLISPPGSHMYRDADYLQQVTHEVASIEASRRDIDFTGYEKDPTSSVGTLIKINRTPLPKIEIKGEALEIGDWVHLINHNDANKPIIAQIFSLWENLEGEKWISVCWYYRPEQTVHRADRIFYENEVMKTGQYRDHQINDIIDKCFVMFITKYIRGRPKDAGNKLIYVCESRYDEETKMFNKIKSWRACIPDEIRNKEYDMYYFERQQQPKKVLSPILHLLPSKVMEDPNAPIPEPTQGKENAPPIIGAIIPAPIPDESTLNPPEIFIPSIVSAPIIPQKPIIPSLVTQTHTSVVINPNNQPQNSRKTHIPYYPPVAFTLPVVDLNSENTQSENIDISENDLENPNKEKNNEDINKNINKSIKDINMKDEIEKINENNDNSIIESEEKAVENIKSVKKSNNFSDEVAALFSRDEQGRVLWFPVPPIDVVSPTLETFVDGRSLAYLANVYNMMENHNEEFKKEKKQKLNIMKPLDDSNFSEFLINALNTMTQNIKSSIH